MIDNNDGANQSETFHQIRGGTIFQDLPPIEQNLSASSTLTDRLLEQLQLELCTDIERLIAAFMIGNLDHRGYLDMTYEEILDFDDFSELHLDLDDIESATLVLRNWNQSVVVPEISENVCCFKLKFYILKIHFFQTLWNICQIGDQKLPTSSLKNWIWTLKMSKNITR